ncbi:suppressyn-like, partial [Rhinopithecus roxellana]|uniref:suppressyn-like n=1 Tax=Rhinopithecus roxellana TaxID=61622 RepID=UPI0012376915
LFLKTKTQGRLNTCFQIWPIIYPTGCCSSLPTRSLHSGTYLTMILIPSAAALLSTTALQSCCECYSVFPPRRKAATILHSAYSRQQSFTHYTHTERSCWGTSVEECVESGKSYYKVKNLGVSGSCNGAICPKGKHWRCFTKIGQWGINTQVLQDIKREQTVAKVKASKPTTTPENHLGYFHPSI